MSMLESIEELRDWATRPDGSFWCPEISEFSDAIEREIAERYIERDKAIEAPLDADGVAYAQRGSATNKRKFVGLGIDMLPCSYIHGAKAPYYSIVYHEDGKLFKGYSSFNIDTVSGYLRDYFTSAERFRTEHELLGGDAE